MTPRAQTEDHLLEVILLMDHLPPAHTGATFLAVLVEEAAPPLLVPHPQQYPPEDLQCPLVGRHLQSPPGDLLCPLEGQHLQSPPEDPLCLPEDLHRFPLEVLLCQGGAPWVVSPVVENIAVRCMLQEVDVLLHMMLEDLQQNAPVDLMDLPGVDLLLSDAKLTSFHIP